MSVHPDEDPGWKLSWRSLRLLVPGYLGAQTRKPRSETGGLELIRQVWTTFTMTTLLFGPVLLLVVPGMMTTDATSWLMGLAALAVACLVAQEIVGRRPLQTADMEELGTSFRTRFFVRTALAQSIAFGGFVGTFMTGRWWLYWSVLPAVLLGLARNAPTRRHLRLEQERLQQAGCSLSLVNALRTATGATGR